MREFLYVIGLSAALNVSCAQVEQKPVVSVVVQQKPLVRILEEDDLLNNSFTKNNLSLTLETEKNNFYEVWVNDVLVEEKEINLHNVDDDAGTQAYQVSNLERYVSEGKNSVEFVVETPDGVRAKRIVALEVGLEDVVLDDITLKLCKRAVSDIAENSGRYWVMVRELQALNRMVPAEYRVSTIVVTYNSLDDNEEHSIPKGGATNAWARTDGIYFGFGLINEFSGTQVVPDVVAHEFGHKLHESLPLSSRFFLEWYRVKMFNFYAVLGNTGLFWLFKDGEYGEMKNAGHPWDSGSELFASAFMIRRNHFDEFLNRLRKFDAGEQKLALDVITIVDSALQMKAEKESYFNDLFFLK